MTFQLTCMAGELARALSLATQVSGREKQIPILRAVRIAATKTACTIAATNNDHGMAVTIAAEGDGVVYVDASMIAPKSAVLRHDKPVTITGDEDGKNITVTQSRTRWKIPVLDGADSFPTDMTKAVKGKSVKMTAGPFLHALSIAPDAIWPGIARTFDMGALLDMGDGKFRVISTNTKVFSVIELDAPALQVEQIIFPNDAMSAVRSLFKDADELEIVATADAMSISAERLIYRTKLVEGQFPDWRKAVEKQAGAALDGEAIASSTAIIETLDRAAAIAEDKNKDGAVLGVRVQIGDGEFSAKATNRTGEEGEDSCECPGSEGLFGVSATHLRKMIGNLGSRDVRLTYSTTDPEKPVVVHAHPAERENYRLVMPMRMAL